MPALAERPNFYPEPPYQPQDPAFIKYVEDNIIWPKHPVLQKLSALKDGAEYLKDQLRLGISMEITSLRSALARIKVSPETISFISISMASIAATGYGIPIHSWYAPDQNRRPIDK